MARYQHGIFAEGTGIHHHLEASLKPGTTASELSAALGKVRASNVEQRTNGGTNLVIGLGPNALELLKLEAIEPFPGYSSPGDVHVAPSTQRDVWVWVHGNSTDLVIDVARQVHSALSTVCVVDLDLGGFVYHDSRDMTGFIDGTANPFPDDAPREAVVGDDSPGAGSSLAVTLRFTHALKQFAELSMPEQQNVIGRAKPDSAKLESKPADSHIARAEVADESGEELMVYRRSVPWATAGEQGLMFVSFGADTLRHDMQMRQMYGMVDDAIVDRLLDFTTPDTGSFWRCPSVEDLDLVAPLG